jgi:hypothetical protein
MENKNTKGVIDQIENMFHMFSSFDLKTMKDKISLFDPHSLKFKKKPP